MGRWELKKSECWPSVNQPLQCSFWQNTDNIWCLSGSRNSKSGGREFWKEESCETLWDGERDLEKPWPCDSVWIQYWRKGVIQGYRQGHPAGITKRWVIMRIISCQKYCTFVNYKCSSNAIKLETSSLLVSDSFGPTFHIDYVDSSA